MGVGGLNEVNANNAELRCYQPRDLEPVCGVLAYNVEITEDDTHRTTL